MLPALAATSWITFDDWLELWLVASLAATLMWSLPRQSQIRIKPRDEKKNPGPRV